MCGCPADNASPKGGPVVESTNARDVKRPGKRHDSAPRPASVQQSHACCPSSSAAERSWLTSDRPRLYLRNPASGQAFHAVSPELVPPIEPPARVGRQRHGNSPRHTRTSMARSAPSQPPHSTSFPGPSTHHSRSGVIRAVDAVCTGATGALRSAEKLLRPLKASEHCLVALHRNAVSARFPQPYLHAWLFGDVRRVGKTLFMPT